MSTPGPVFSAVVRVSLIFAFRKFPENKEVNLCIGNPDCLPFWYPKFTISVDFAGCHWMREPVLYRSMVRLYLIKFS